MNKNNKMSPTMTLWSIFTIILFITLMSIINGFVLMKLWGWFIVPYFNAPELTISMAIGVALTMGVFRSSPTKYKNLEEDVAWTWTKLLLFPWITLLVGCIVKGFLPEAG